MPDLPKAETYQLWAMIGGQPISLGLMGNSPAQASFTVSGSATVSALAVTVEPAGGLWPRTGRPWPPARWSPP